MANQMKKVTESKTTDANASETVETIDIVKSLLESLESGFLNEKEVSELQLNVFNPFSPLDRSGFFRTKF